MLGARFVTASTTVQVNEAATNFHRQMGAQMLPRSPMLSHRASGELDPGSHQ
jgi:hypothetical protein